MIQVRKIVELDLQKGDASVQLYGRTNRNEKLKADSRVATQINSRENGSVRIRCLWMFNEKKWGYKRGYTFTKKD